jgi:hypothetical protein
MRRHGTWMSRMHWNVEKTRLFWKYTQVTQNQEKNGRKGNEAPPPSRTACQCRSHVQQCIQEAIFEHRVKPRYDSEDRWCTVLYEWMRYHWCSKSSPSSFHRWVLMVRMNIELCQQDWWKQIAHTSCLWKTRRPTISE